MKKLSLLLVFTLFFSCGNLPQSNVNVEDKNVYKLDKFLTKFISTNKKMFQNDVQYQDAFIKLKEQLILFIDTNGMNDYPLKIISISPIDNGYGDGYIIHFRNESNLYGLDSISKNTELDIFAVVNKEKTMDLKQSDTDFYTLSNCSKTEFFPSEDKNQITSDLLFAPLGISQSYGSYEYDIDNLITHPAEIKHHKSF